MHSWWRDALRQWQLLPFGQLLSRRNGVLWREQWRRNSVARRVSGLIRNGKKKQHYFTRRDGEIISIAGLYEELKNPETGKPLRSCTMIIGPANNIVSPLHDRMPIILERDKFSSWLSGSAGTEMLRSADNGVLQERAVSMRVNSSRADENDATLIDAIT